MHTINESRDLDSSRYVLQSLVEARGLLEVLGSSLTGNMPLDGSIRDGFPLLLDMIAVRLRIVETELEALPD